MLNLNQRVEIAKIHLFYLNIENVFAPFESKKMEVIFLNSTLWPPLLCLVLSSSSTIKAETGDI